MPKTIMYNQNTKNNPSTSLRTTSAVFCLLLLLSFIAPASILAKESDSSKLDSIVIVYRKSDQKMIASDQDRSADEELQAVVHDFGGQYDDYEAIFISPKPDIKNGIKNIDLVQDGSGKFTKAEVTVFTDDEIKEQKEKEKLERDKQKEKAQAAGFDLAEGYETIDQVIEAGDVVSISDTGLRKSSKPYDSKLMGIISTNPGILLGGNDNANKDKKPVALSGRVPVKVSTINGPIAVGERITSSSIPGVGMRATESGTTIGIALEPLADGLQNADCRLQNDTNVCTILVFVNLGYSKIDVNAEVATGETLPIGATQFGLITFPGNIEAWDMKGKYLAYVQGILSSSGTWSIDEEGNLVVKKVTAQELCLDDICIKKEQLKALLELVGNNPALLNQSNQSNGADQPNQSDLPAEVLPVEQAGSTEAGQTIQSETDLSTFDVNNSPTEELAPTPIEPPVLTEESTPASEPAAPTEEPAPSDESAAPTEGATTEIPPAETQLEGF